MWGAIASIAGGVLSGAIGASAADSAASRAARLAGQSVGEIKNIDLPDIEKMKLILENPELVGQLTPEAERSLNLSPSAMGDVSADQDLVNQQRSALDSLSELADGGLTEGDRAASREIQRGVSQDAEARRKSILMNMAQRGSLGSGMELAAQLDSNQKAVDQQSAAADRLQQQAQNRALQAIQQQGNMASSMRSQDVGEQSNAARAKDAINQFNVANQQQVGARNVQNRNNAQQKNLAARQSIENNRANLANQQQQNNKQLLQTQYNNQMGQAQAVANARAGQQQAIQQQGQQQAGMYGGVGQGLIGIGSSLLSNNKDDK